MQNQQFIEVLEERRLMSVSASSLIRPFTKGAQWTTETLQGGKVTITSAQKVIGKATFNKSACTEIDGTVKSVTGTSTTKDYIGFDKSKNIVTFGHVSITTIGGNTSTSTDTYSPDSLDLPVTLTAKKIYKATSTNNNKTVTTPGGSTTTFSETIKFTVELTSYTTHSVKVPAGTFKAYLLDETVAVTIGGKTTKGSLQLWDAAGVGIVKSVVGTGKTAIINELTKFKT